MANGLLEHPKQKQDWEDVGDQYLNELISRCLTQMNQDYGDVFTFKMHDLIHDLALEVSQKEFKIVNCQTKTIDENVRHLSFCDDKQINVAQVFTKLKNVRTVMVQEVSKESKAIHESLVSLCVSNFKYIRALCLQDSPLATLPNSIGALKHLRELDLTNCCNIKKLPSSFYKLRRLQSLRMRGAPLMQLPVSMESLIELRYLEITIKDKKLKGSRLRNWTSLQCLVLVDCDNLECLSKKMKCLTGLSHLILYGCTELSNRYYINGRLDWQEWLKNDCLRDGLFK
ncbi:putative disease resistance protein RGA3 [Gossypium arboreum]|uniref:putative disease resistance protein RGA3 n=1 Tax=Gossypium arboreum TaxID=29729 RepID=UPI0008191E7F|nr:putative disease resistance protein RGA3 [Gossypium arboreum]